MSALYILIGVSLLVAIGFLGGFLWAMRQGQYEDDYTPSVRMLFEDTPEGPSEDNQSVKS
jgi:cbb3-type cytochrome oxidase maturation protein